MKDLSVYKAEIFRRSSERIRARRSARNRALAFCIPVFLIVGIWSVMILPAMMPAGSEDLFPEGDIFKESMGTAVPYDSVKIELLEQEDTFYQYSDVSNVKKLYSLIDSFFFSDAVKDESNEEKQESAEGTSPDDEATDTNKELQCRIVFTSHDGKEKSYLLYSNTLTDELTGNKEILTESELKELKAYLNAN